ncbi:MAG: alpha/beta hydrolase [Dehalococcoidia bacterium]
MSSKEEKVTFFCEGQKLYANFGLPRIGAPCILMSHGFEANKDGTKWSFLAPRLAEEGYSTFRFSYRGCGREPEKSEGKFENTTLTGRIKDYKAALDYLGSKAIDQGRIGVMGSSFGGEVPIAAKDPRIKALILLATPSRTELPAEEQLQAYKRRGYFRLPSGQRLKMSYFEDIQRYDLCKAMEKLNRPVLIIHGGEDEEVSVDNAYELYDHAREPKRLDIIQGGEHALHRPEHMARILELSREWFQRYL